MTVSLFFLTLSAFSQGISVTYEIIQNNLPPGSSVIKALLVDNDSLSKFINLLPPEIASKLPPSEGIIKDKRAALCYSDEGFLRTQFSVRDTLHSMKWQLMGKSQTILGYPCLSAATRFRGRTYTAYYTRKLPISNGPRKLGGLPGLILAAKTDDGFIEWRATNVTLGKVPPINVAKMRARKNIDWNTFVARYKEDVKRRIKYVRSQGTLPNEYEAKMLITSLEIFYPELQTGEGLSY